VLIEVGLLRYAYIRLGLSSRVAALLLIASLAGSYFNVPVAQLSTEHLPAGRELNFFGISHKHRRLFSPVAGLSLSAAEAPALG
jgi:uncharacterized membrane protein